MCCFFFSFFSLDILFLYFFIYVLFHVSLPVVLVKNISLFTFTSYLNEIWVYINRVFKLNDHNWILHDIFTEKYFLMVSLFGH